MIYFKRAYLSALSALSAVVLVSLGFALGVSDRQHFANDFIGGIVGIGMFAFGGWLLSLPFIIPNRIYNLSTIWLFIIGTAIGPVFFTLLGFLDPDHKSNFGLLLSPFTGVCTLISCLSTAMYLVLIGRLRRPAS